MSPSLNHLVRGPLIGVCIILLGGSCELFERAQAVPEDKLVYVGTWKSQSGFTITIRPEGRADLHQLAAGSHPDHERLNIKVAAQDIKGMQVKLPSAGVLQLVDPLNYAKEYEIGQAPHEVGGRTEMILNGVTFTKQ